MRDLNFNSANERMKVVEIVDDKLFINDDDKHGESYHDSRKIMPKLIECLNV